jgi:hypothetical protein
VIEHDACGSGIDERFSDYPSHRVAWQVRCHGLRKGEDAAAEIVDWRNECGRHSKDDRDTAVMPGRAGRACEIFEFGSAQEVLRPDLEEGPG